MKKIALLLTMCFLFATFAFAARSHATVTQVRHRMQHRVQRHHAHRAGRHHTARHRHYRSV